ncbi:MAG: hypothetical protein K9H16_03890 [Bacteroidales bacterium]|nr:hypothetical protein [Bacteroidales bacterium]
MKINHLVLAMTLLAFTMQAHAVEVERTLAQKKYEVTENAKLEIIHKFGKIKCTNWAESAISVKITANVEASSTEKANNLIDRISINLDGDFDGVSIESDFNEKIFNGKKDQVSIDIEIMMPENIRLELDHKFGNAYIEVVNGESNIDIEYGSIDIKALKGEVNDIEIGFGEARINYLNGGDLDSSYSTVSIDESDELTIESSYSNISIGKVQKLDIENEGGNIDLGEVSVIELQSTFSDFKIGKLHESIQADTEYGSLRLKSISNSFSDINIQNSFGSVTLDFNENAAFTLEATMEFCNLNYPQNKAQFSKRIVETSKKYYKGVMGEGSAKASLTIESSFGNVDINM